MSNAANTTTAPATWSKTRGGYGRPAMMLRNSQWREVAIMVTLPKVYFEEYGKRYMVTDRRNHVPIGQRFETVEFVKRADAVAYAEATYL